MPTFKDEHLRKVSLLIFRAAGVPKNEAEIVTNSMVEANLAGHDSHGIMKIMRYMRELKEGVTRLDAAMKVERETSSTALFDADYGFGQVAATNAMELAINKAKANGIGAVAIKRCNHVGRLAEYTAMAAENDMIGIIFTSSAGARGGPNVAPYGGVDAKYGTNPLSVGIPTGLGRHIILDMSTSIVAGGKIRLAKARREKIPEGWIYDSQGRPSTDPGDLYDNGNCIGALLPFGGPKGSGLGLIIELIGGVLAGAGCGSESRGNGPFMIAVNIDAFMPIDEFKSKTDKFIKDVKSSRKAQGMSEILLAGEPEYNKREERLRDGIFIEDGTWKLIEGLAESLNVDLRKTLG